MLLGYQPIIPNWGSPSWNYTPTLEGAICGSTNANSTRTTSWTSNLSFWGTNQWSQLGVVQVGTIPRLIKELFGVAPYISGNSTWIFMKLQTLLGYQPIIPSRSSPSWDYAPTLKGAIWGSSLYLCKFNSDLYESLNFSSWGTNLLSQLV